MRLFRVSNQHKLELVRDELLLVKEFRDIIQFGTGQYTPEQYFIFIYMYCDYTSPYSTRDDEVRYAKSLFEAGINSNYVMDDLVKAGVKKYLSIRDNPSIKALKAVSRTLESSTLVMDNATKRLKTNLEHLDKIDINTVTDESQLAIYNAKFKMIKEDLSYVMKLTPDLEKSVEIVNKLLDKAIKDDFQELKSRGDRVIGNRADPK